MWSSVKAILAFAVFLATSTTALAQVEELDVHLVDAGWGRVAVVLVLPGVADNVAIKKIEAETDESLAVKTLTFKLAYAKATARSGHLTVKLYAIDKTTSKLVPVKSLAEKVFGKPYAFVVYDRDFMPPVLSRHKALVKSTVEWNVAEVGFVSAGDDNSTDDLEYLREQDHADYVRNRAWVKGYLGTVPKPEDNEDDDL